MKPPQNEIEWMKGEYCERIQITPLPIVEPKDWFDKLEGKRNIGCYCK